MCEDFPTEIERRRRKLWPFFCAARAVIANDEGERVKVHLKFDKLVINNQVFTVDNLDEIPTKYHPTRFTSRKQTDEITLFFSKTSPLSNFHHSEFQLDDMKFNCVEQYLAFNKAQMFSEPIISKNIMHTDDPRSQKYLARDSNLNIFDTIKWRLNAVNILRAALEAKFSQNDHLKTELLATWDSLLGEANPTDNYFGIGLSLNNPRALIKSQWRGDNLKGATFMSIREKIK